MPVKCSIYFLSITINILYLKLRLIQNASNKKYKLQICFKCLESFCHLMYLNNFFTISYMLLHPLKGSDRLPQSDLVSNFTSQSGFCTLQLYVLLALLIGGPTTFHLFNSNILPSRWALCPTSSVNHPACD